MLHNNQHTAASLTQPGAPGKHGGERGCVTPTPKLIVLAITAGALAFRWRRDCLYLLFHFVILGAKSGSGRPSPEKAHIDKDAVTNFMDG